ncbi:peptidoglycan D,D-transpeptidase FtsI family protein [Bacillus sp. SJS]|uniref:peptidoglycan D,D-transpeptidase FtsI family protein n=1 Tax=Bacillus sp. SJS TaxID=1423321 RepID=UPI0009ED4974|nr:penicillin-binding protein 2 [Bacillus sp. SJS]
MTEQAANSSENRKLKRSRHFRINIFFFGVFLIFTLLIIRLGVIQIVKGEEYTKEVSRTEANISSYPAPRGKMYDRYGRVVVDNVSVPAITYTVEKSTKTADKLKTAKKLAEFIEVEEKDLQYTAEQKSERDIRDYWLAANEEEAKTLLTKKDLEKSGNEQYKLQVERVPSNEVDEIRRNPEELEMAVLFKRFSAGYQYEPQVIKSQAPPKDKVPSAKNMLTNDEMARVSENIESMPGINIITDWNRNYVYGDTLGSILGGVTSSSQGILQERKAYYQARGYARNDRVGKSRLEYQYEEYLNPRKAKVEYVTDKNGNTISEKVVDPGRRGLDLQLTFDAELQKEAEKIIEEELKKVVAVSPYADRAFAVMMDPYQGDIIAMAGKGYDRYNSKKYYDFSYGAYTTQYEMGSAVKGATILAGYQEGLQPGTSFNDSVPILLKGAKPKKSLHPSGWVDDREALEVSSNVYMFRTAMEIADIPYVPNGKFPAGPAALQKFRNLNDQFGLGVPTGIDLPGEAHGQRSHPDTVGGLLLDVAIGQYDTYTPLQMAQYISVIANGGYRIEPRVVKSIHEPVNENKLGPLVVEKEPEILNAINNTPNEIERIKAGMKLVTKGSRGTARAYFKGLDVAGKTGTTQSFYTNIQLGIKAKPVSNVTFVGYYPTDHPKVAFSVTVPGVREKSSATTASRVIADRLMKAYTELEKKYKGQENISQVKMEESKESELN